jgi:hypothetical protein
MNLTPSSPGCWPSTNGPEHAALHALIVALLDLVDTLTARVAELEAEAGRHSGNSSRSPSGALAQRQAHKADAMSGRKASPSGPRASSPVPRVPTWTR